MRMEWATGRDPRVKVAQDTHGLHVTLKGHMQARELAETLDAVHEEAVAWRYPAVTLDVTALTILEPPAVKAIIKWAMRQAELHASERYAVSVCFSENVASQKVGVEAIAHLCPYVQLTPQA